MSHSPKITSLLLLLAGLLAAKVSRASDCNRNGIEDALEISAGDAADCNRNGLPDGCDIAPTDFGFSAPVFSPTRQGWIQALAAADLDGDRDVDLAVAFLGSSSPSTIFLLFNQGNGRFMPSLEVGAGLEHRSLAAGDVDGDGDADLVSVEGYVRVFLNDGDGKFSNASTISSGGDWSFALADLDLDGDLDLAVAQSTSETGGVGVLSNGGGGRFEWWGGASVDHRPMAVVAADLDGDGYPDLATANGPSSTISVVLNRGQGRLVPAGSFATGGSHPAALQSGDLDGDGDQDLAAAHFLSETISVLLNDGQGAFRLSADLPVGGGANSVVASDLDGDGDLDLATQSLFEDGLPGVSVFSNDGRGTFQVPLQLRIGPRPGPGLASDLDGDGHPELVFSVGENVAVLFNQTTAAVSHDLNRNRLPDECEGVPFHRGDPNDDGLLDISDAIHLFDFLFLAAAGPACREAADANNDNLLDLSDGIFLLGHIFLGGRPPPEPGPAGLPCGRDVDLPGAPGILGCDSFESC